MANAEQQSLNDDMPTLKADETLDASGLSCPLPVLKTRKRLKSMKSGQVLQVLATDPASFVDIPHFCNVTGNELLRWYEEESTFYYLIQRGD